MNPSDYLRPVDEGPDWEAWEPEPDPVDQERAAWREIRA